MFPIAEPVALLMTIRCKAGLSDWNQMPAPNKDLDEMVV